MAPAVATQTSVKLTEITPAIAVEWLGFRPDYQRKIDERQVKKLILAIQRGEWRENGATIVFNEKGELIDGQHRLSAIAQVGKTVWSLVVRDVSKEESTFQTIGDEKSRKLTDFIGGKYATVISSVSRMYWGLCNGVWPIGHGGDVAPLADVLKYVRKWQPMIEPTVEPLWQAGRISGQYSFCVFLVFYFSHIRPVEDKERLAEFFARLGDGLNLTATDPVYKLRNRFMNIASTGKMRRTSAQAIILKALYLYLDGKTCSALRFEPDREEFPELRGYRE